jgi:hypothetical protein
MNHTGRITVSINGKSYPLKFGMGALLHFSETLGYDVEKTINELTESGFKQIKSVSKFVYSAIYVEAQYKDKVLDLSYDDIVNWVDTSRPSELTQVVNTIMSGLSTITEIPFAESNSESKKK